jgi:hypothetical protein
MRAARYISFGITALGLLLTAAGAGLDLGAVVTLTGMLLVVAGIVKIATVLIWQSFFSIPIDYQEQTEDRSQRTGSYGRKA